MIYLASCYSDPDPEIREYRFAAACKAAAHLMREGLHVFSPIAASHPLTEYGLPGDWTFWEAQDRFFLDVCDSMIVLKLPGWDISHGVQAEIRIMKAAGKPITYLEWGE